MTEHYEKQPDGTIRREHEPNAEDMTLAEALNLYRGTVLRIQTLYDELGTSLHREESLRSVLMEAMDEKKASAEALIEESEGHARAEAMVEALNQARLAVSSFEREQEDS